jgi:hypothetical protein
MSIQPALFALPVAAPATLASAKARGAVFTRQVVVDFMLDLACYKVDRPLHRFRLLEPSFGGGRFVLTAARRLLDAWHASGQAGDDSVLDGAIQAVEVDAATFAEFRGELIEFLRDAGLPELSAQRVARAWLVNGDFLFGDVEGPFDFVVGNPPYVRQENMAPEILAACRASFPTMVGRADLYVPFFERSLGLLAPGGRLSFICSDAWTKNDYGRELRKLVARRFALRAYVDMYGVDAFESDVGAYTSVTVIERGHQGPVRASRATSAHPAYLSALARSLGQAARGKDDAQESGSDEGPSPTAESGSWVAHPVHGGGPWLLRGDWRAGAVRLVEGHCPALEDAACRVGIGVATGADRVFTAPFDALDVEESRRLPLAVNRDVVDGVLSWTGKGVINPWADGGGLVDLAEFPRLAAYLAPHRERLARRHTAKRDQERLWYKTIDRITPSLTREPKLLVPDMRDDGDAIAYDPGDLYPHHNLYYIISQTWDLLALQAVLRSGMAKLFVDAYAVKIGGGYLRFQAQYLRRIRVPGWDGIGQADRELLVEAGEAGAKVAPGALERIYGLPPGSLACLADGGTE